VFISTLGAMVVPQLLGGGKSSFVGNAIRDQFHDSPLDYPLGAAMAVTVLVFVAAAMWVYQRFATTPEAAA
jgi:spermidine/putrescine transport system permease protein